MSRDALILRTDYFDDAAAFAALVDLLCDTFGIDIGLQDRFGGPDKTSMPFGYFDANGRCVANFSAFSMPLLIEGKVVRAVGYQSGAVRPEYRGQGLYRDLMKRAFACAREQDFELGILLTDKLGLYESYGFRSVPQHVVRGKASAAGLKGEQARPISLEHEPDAELVRRLLAIRQPVSNVFSVVNQAEMFLLNACFDPAISLSHLPAQDAVIAWKRDEDGTVVLLDVVGAQIPSLAEIAAALDLLGGDIVAAFPPDRLDWPDGRAEPYRGYCNLMIVAMKDVRLPDRPFILSPMAEF
jgi:GNAT superfamily N-acetyltransferase